MSQLSKNLKGSQSYVWSTDPLEMLGQGATGAVYRCRHKKTGELYAVKTFNPLSHMRPDAIQSREFEVLRKVNHRNIVKLYAIEQEQTTHYNVVIMELCKCSLYNILNEPANSFGVIEEEFIIILVDVAEGMKYLKDRNVVHRDIKPGNIMLCIGDDGRSVYKLTDFGAARELEEDQNFMSLYGTEEYLYPDIYQRAVLRRPHGQMFSSNVDLWSLGVTLYHVATGKLPFRPYGGRQNKETMYHITTEKEPGVISGIQLQDRGPIEYSKDLPRTCPLSQGLRNFVVPIIAGLLESRSDRMWPFERFFAAVNEVAQKIVIHVFSTPTCSPLRIYIGKHQTFSTFQELIAEQTDLSAANQFMLHEYRHFEQVVDRVTHAEKYPATTVNNPIILYPTDINDYPRVDQLDIPKYPKFDSSIDTERDYSLSKSCLAIVCHIKITIQLFWLKQSILHKAVLMYIYVLCQDSIRMRDYMQNLRIQVVLTNKKEAIFYKSVNKLRRLFMLTLQARSDHRNEWNFLWNDLDDIVINIDNQSTEIENSFTEIQTFMDEFHKIVVAENQLGVRWKDNWGCQEKDKCVAKCEQLIILIQKTKDDFKRDKEQVKLSYNDEQIHKYEKNKLNEHCAKAMSLVTDHCYPNLKRQFRKFGEWFNLCVKYTIRLVKVETRLTAVSDKSTSFSDLIDQKEHRFDDKLEEALVELERNIGTSASTDTREVMQQYPPRDVVVRESTQATPNVPQGASNYALPEVRPARQYGKANSAVIEIHKEIRALWKTGTDLKNLVNENSALLKELEGLKLGPEMTDENNDDNSEEITGNIVHKYGDGVNNFRDKHVGLTAEGGEGSTLNTYSDNNLVSQAQTTSGSI